MACSRFEASTSRSSERSPERRRGGGTLNFFGHASIAGFFSTDPDFVLGSMIPDLHAMAGIGRSDWAQPEIAAGVALHHATDALYHDHPLVKERMAREAEELARAGIPRRIAQALAHVGLELVTDGLLSVEDAAVTTFESAVRRAVGPDGPVEATLQTEDDHELWRRVAGRLLSGDFPGRYREADFVATRLEIVFRRRPRLAFGEEIVPLLSDWAGRLATEVGGEVALVRDEILLALQRDLQL